MNALERHIDEIKKYKKAIDKTDSIYLKNDYYKKIDRMFKELKEYCKYRGYNFNEIIIKYKL